MTYRTPDLAAECAALRAEVAALRAKRARAPTRWSAQLMAGAVLTPAGAVAALYALAAFWATLMFVIEGLAWFRAPWVVRLALVLAVGAVWWALAFVRRVPVEGARP